MTIIELFDRGARINPQAVAFTSAGGEESLTYESTRDLTHRIAAALKRDRLTPGSPVAVLSPNSVLMYPCVLGILRAGCVWVQLNSRSPTVELADLLALVKCRAILISSRMADRLEELRSRVPTLELAVAIDGADEGAPDLQEWMSGAGVTVPLPPLEPEAPAAISGTGGTTGRSKAVVIPQRAFVTMVHAFNSHMPEVDPVNLVAAPMTHAAGCSILPVLSVGGTNVVHERVHAGELLESIARHRVSRLFLPPTAIYALLSHPKVRESDVSTLKYFLYAGAPMSVEKLREAIKVFGPVMTQCYGQAEAPMICTFFSPEEHAEAASNPQLAGRLRSCGRPSLVASLAIKDPDGAFQPAGETGEIAIRSWLEMLGYHDDPESTRALDRGGGWRGTGDVGYIDDDGFVYIVDRTRDLIITGGFNVFPSEVEQVIWAHPAVNDCAVIGLPDDKWGERVTAVVELKDGETVDADELIATCKATVGSVKTPKEVIFRPLPRSPVGKVLKRALRDEYWVGRDRLV